MTRETAVAVSCGGSPKQRSFALESSTSIMVPVDKGNVAYWIFYLLGIGVLAPWNAFITAVDYFSAVYPGGHMDRKFTISYLPTMMVTLILVMRFGKNWGGKSRVELGYAGFTIILIAVPLVDVFFVRDSRGTHLAEAVMLMCLVALGILDGIAQGAVMGDASYLPDIYQQGYGTGTGTCGVVISILRIISKLMLPETPDGLRKSTAIYFICSGCITLVSLCLYKYVLPNLPIIKYYKQLNTSSEPGTLGDYTEKDNIGLVSASEKPTSYTDVWTKLKNPSITLILIYVVTLTIFPGVPAEDVHSKVLGDWYGILLITIFNIADMVGKSMPTFVPTIQRGPLLTYMGILRLVFVPVFLVAMKWFGNPVLFFVLTFFLGLTNGYLTVNCMIVGAKCLNGIENELGGNIVVLSLVIGLVLGAIGGWGLLGLSSL